MTLQKDLAESEHAENELPTRESIAADPIKLPICGEFDNPWRVPRRWLGILRDLAIALVASAQTGN